MTKETKINIIGIILAGLQPIIWFMVGMLLVNIFPKYEGAITFACIVCTAIFVIGILWLRDYIVNDGSTWD